MKINGGSNNEVLMSQSYYIFHGFFMLSERGLLLHIH